MSPFLEWLRIQQALTYVHPYSRVLDVGCGRARLLDYVNPERYVGLDILAEVLEHNRAHHPTRRFASLDINAGPLPEDLGEFDVIIMLAVLEHLPEPEVVLSNLAARLARGGRIVLTTPHPIGERVLELGAKVGLFSADAEDEHQPLLAREGIEAAGRRANLNMEVYERFLLGFNQLAVLRP